MIVTMHFIPAARFWRMDSLYKNFGRNYVPTYNIFGVFLENDGLHFGITDFMPEARD